MLGVTVLAALLAYGKVWVGDQLQPEQGTLGQLPGDTGGSREPFVLQGSRKKVLGSYMGSYTAG